MRYFHCLYTGFGHGLIYTPAIVVVGYYFDRRRTMASGVASVGAGIGMMVFPPAVTALRQVFTWREIMVFISGINLHICVLGALMRPLPLVPSGDEEEGGYRTPSTNSRQSSRGTLYDLELQYLQIRKSSRTRYVEEFGEMSEEEDEEEGGSFVGSGYLSQNLSVGANSRFSDSSRASPSVPEPDTVIPNPLEGCTETEVKSMASGKLNDNESVSLSYKLVVLDDEVDTRALDRKDIKSLTEIPDKLSMARHLHRGDSSHNSCSKLNSDVSKAQKPKSLSKDAKQKATSVRFKKQSNSVCTKSLCIFCVSIFTAGIGLSIVYLHLSAFAMEHGASEHEASILISILGVSSIASRIFTGLAGNDHSIDNVILYIGTFGVAGMCTLLCPLIGWSYIGRVLFAISFGFYGSCFNVLLAPLTVELVGIDALNMAFGIEMAVCGVAYLLGPPLAGKLYKMCPPRSS